MRTISMNTARSGTELNRTRMNITMHLCDTAIRTSRIFTIDIGTVESAHFDDFVALEVNSGAHTAACCRCDRALRRPDVWLGARAAIL